MPINNSKFIFFDDFVLFRGIFVFFRGKNCWGIFVFLSGIFELFRGDFNIIPFKFLSFLHEITQDYYKKDL